MYSTPIGPGPLTILEQRTFDDSTMIPAPAADVFVLAPTSVPVWLSLLLIASSLARSVPMIALRLFDWLGFYTPAQVKHAAWWFSLVDRLTSFLLPQTANYLTRSALSWIVSAILAILWHPYKPNKAKDEEDSLMAWRLREAEKKLRVRTRQLIDIRHQLAEAKRSSRWTKEGPCSSDVKGKRSRKSQVWY